MVAEAYIAFKKGMIEELLLTEIEEYVFAVYGRVRLREEDMEPILTLTLQDKKNRGGQVFMALLDGPGSCAFDIAVSKADMKQGLIYYRG
jgi:3-dehydroquinate synthase